MLLYNRETSLSTPDLPHYNILFTQPLQQAGLRVIYQPSCLINGYNGVCWPIQFPAIDNWDNTVVIMHCQDFVSIRNGSCPELEAIEQHFGVHADKVVVIHWNIGLRSVYTGPLHLVHFPTHSYELLINIGREYNNWIKNFEQPRTKTWQCLNGVPRPHRRLVVDHIKNIPNGILSFAEQIPLPEWSYNNYFGCENEKNWEKLQYVYSDCDVNVVTETQYYETPGIISEKTLMAFLAQQVPIVIGYKGIVEDCESLGFDMFRDLVDTSYDFNDDSLRWRTAIDLNSSLLKNGIDRSKLHSRLKNNLNVALSLPERFALLYHHRINHIVQENFLNRDTY